MDLRSRALAAASVVAALLLAGCGNSSQEPAAGELPDSSPTPAATQPSKTAEPAKPSPSVIANAPTGSAAPAPAPAQTQSQESWQVQQDDPRRTNTHCGRYLDAMAAAANIDGTFPGAGDGCLLDMPDVPISKFHDGYAVIRSQSGNWVCAFGNGKAYCGVRNWIDDDPYPIRDPKNASGTVSGWILDLTPSFGPEIADLINLPVFDRSVDAEFLDDGDVLHGGGFACGSTEPGWTCWNLETGHGAFMTRDGFTAF